MRATKSLLYAAALGPALHCACGGGSDARSAAAGDAVACTLRTEQRLVVAYGDEEPVPEEIPELEASLLIRPAADDRLEVEVEDARVVPDTGSAKRRRLFEEELRAQPPSGLLVRVLLDEGGVPTAVEALPPPGASGTVRHLLADLEQALLLCLLPAGAAGAPATRPLRIAGVNGSVRTRLRPAAGDPGSWSGDLLLFAPPQALELEGLPAGAVARLIELEGRGTLSVRPAPSGSVPLAAEARMHLRFEARVLSPQGPRPVTAELTACYRLAR